jgi:hypothetical protein
MNASSLELLIGEARFTGLPKTNSALALGLASNSMLRLTMHTKNVLLDKLVFIVFSPDRILFSTLPCTTLYL